jgi:hypothetical protein
MTGCGVCSHHGGKARHVRAKAQQRLEEATLVMAKELLKMATDDSVAEPVRLRAICEALDRGLGASRQNVAIEVSQPKPFESILMSMEHGGSRAAYRGEQEPILRSSPQAELTEYLEAEVLDESDGIDQAVFAASFDSADQGETFETYEVSETLPIPNPPRPTGLMPAEEANALVLRNVNRR